MKVRLLPIRPGHYECAEVAFAEYLVVREPQAVIVRPLALYG